MPFWRHTNCIFCTHLPNETLFMDICLNRTHIVTDRHKYLEQPQQYRYRWENIFSNAFPSYGAVEPAASPSLASEPWRIFVNFLLFFRHLLIPRFLLLSRRHYVFVLLFSAVVHPAPVSTRKASLNAVAIGIGSGSNGDDVTNRNSNAWHNRRTTDCAHCECTEALG